LKSLNKHQEKDYCGELRIEALGTAENLRSTRNNNVPHLLAYPAATKGVCARCRIHKKKGAIAPFSLFDIMVFTKALLF
jgi:hypothetical protein